MKKIIASLMLVITFLLSSCARLFTNIDYLGEHKDLYTVAINSLLWNTGASSGADFKCDSDIHIIETDNFGRVLFQYTETAYTDDVAFSSLLIMQSSDEEQVYYYEDFNFISKEKPYYSYDRPNFDINDIESLKRLNDWNKELNLEKCVRKNITNTKSTPPIEKSKLKEICSSYDGDFSRHTDFLTEDSYGRFICYSFFYAIDRSKKYIVILFQKDLSYSIFIPDSIYDYQSQLSEFKKQNNWNVKP